MTNIIIKNKLIYKIACRKARNIDCFIKCIFNNNFKDLRLFILSI